MGVLSVESEQLSADDPRSVYTNMASVLNYIQWISMIFTKAYNTAKSLLCLLREQNLGYSVVFAMRHFGIMMKKTEREKKLKNILKVSNL